GRHAHALARGPDWANVRSAERYALAVASLSLDVVRVHGAWLRPAELQPERYVRDFQRHDVRFSGVLSATVVAGGRRAAAGTCDFRETARRAERGDAAPVVFAAAEFSRCKPQRRRGVLSRVAPRD